MKTGLVALHQTAVASSRTTSTALTVPTMALTHVPPSAPTIVARLWADTDSVVLRTETPLRGIAATEQNPALKRTLVSLF